MAYHGLLEVDSIEIKVIVDNEVDPISPSGNPAVQYAGLMQGQPFDPLPDGHGRGDAEAELRMGNICCAAHGLSLMIVREPPFFSGPPSQASQSRTRSMARAQAD